MTSLLVSQSSRSTPDEYVAQYPPAINIVPGRQLSTSSTSASIGRIALGCFSTIAATAVGVGMGIGFAYLARVSSCPDDIYQKCITGVADSILCRR